MATSVHQHPLAAIGIRQCTFYFRVYGLDARLLEGKLKLGGLRECLRPQGDCSMKRTQKLEAWTEWGGWWAKGRDNSVSRHKQNPNVPQVQATGVDWDLKSKITIPIMEKVKKAGRGVRVPGRDEGNGLVTVLEPLPPYNSVQYLSKILFYHEHPIYGGSVRRKRRNGLLKDMSASFTSYVRVLHESTLKLTTFENQLNRERFTINFTITLSLKLCARSQATHLQDVLKRGRSRMCCDLNYCSTGVPCDSEYWLLSSIQRKHNELDTGSAVSTSAPSSTPIAASGQAMAGDKTPSYAWSGDLAGLTMDQLPSVELVERFKLLYNDATKGFRKSFCGLHLTIEARDRLQCGAEGDNIPEDILKTLKGPVYQFNDGIRLEAEAAVQESQEVFNKMLSETRKKGTALQLEKLNIAIQLLRDQTDVNDLVNTLKSNLIDLVAELHVDVGIEDNTGRWNPYIARVVNTLARNLNNTKFAVALEIRRERETKAANAVAVATAQADVEMKDANKTVQELIVEILDEREKKKPQTSKEPTAPQKKKSKPNPSGSGNSNAAASTSNSACSP
ncbi:hypothetical protein B0H16DRAFT_1811105 [Mycena metata]|uniref:Uncharacterized protein n=1 Tax=Mycena metata TaxID=1033252 RepID=A0AAD7JD48_9AGAR|nr:hypothetical protein B0H16DRAFT_1811105 [Mycena metata]